MTASSTSSLAVSAAPSASVGRNWSTCGIRPYVRAACNPDADSWVADFVAWWIDQDSGFPIPGRIGVIRYVVRGPNDTLIWGDSPEELLQHLLKPKDLPPGTEVPQPKSVPSLTCRAKRPTLPVRR
jgi:hypothetical protein